MLIHMQIDIYTFWKACSRHTFTYKCQPTYSKYFKFRKTGLYFNRVKNNQSFQVDIRTYLHIHVHRIHMYTHMYTCTRVYIQKQSPDM